MAARKHMALILNTTLIIRARLYRLFFLMAIISSTLPLTSYGQASPTVEIPETLAAAEAETSHALNALNSRISIIEKNDTADNKQKAELNWLFEAQAFLKKSLETIERSKDHYNTYQEVPLHLKRIEQELASPQPKKHEIYATKSLPVLEQMLDTARTKLEIAQKKRNEIEAEATRRNKRLQEILEEESNARERQIELNKLLENLSISGLTKPNGNGSEESTARQTAAKAELNYLKLLLLELKQEKLSYETRHNLLRARRQLAERKLLFSAQSFNALEKHINLQRKTAAVRAMQEAESTILATTSAHPLVQKIVEKNQTLAAELTQVAAQSTLLSEDKKKLEDTLSTLQRKYYDIKEKIAKIGLTDVIGLKLRSNRNQLPESSSHISSLQKRRTEVNRVQLRRIELEDRLLELVDINQEVQRLLPTSEDLLNKLESQTLVNALQHALNEQREKYLSELIKAYDIYFEQHLFPMMESERELIMLINEYREFIDTHILWIQSAPALGAEDLKRMGAAIPWLLSPASISQTLNKLGQDILDNPFSSVSVLLIIFLLAGFYSRLREKLSELGRYVTKLSKAKFTDTLMAAVITALMVLPWPLLIYLIAWRVKVTDIENTYSLAVSSGLYAIAYLLFLGLLLRQICRPKGLGVAHFRWKTESLNLVRRQLTWFLPVALPLAFIVATTFDQPAKSHHDSLGRFAFIILMIACSAFLYKLFKPPAGLLKDEIAKHPGGWLDRLSGIWFPLLSGAPIILAITAANGYFYTAIQLCLYIIGTIVLILTTNIVREFFIRWLSITQRKLALKQWRKQREAKASTEDKSEKIDSIKTSGNEEPRMDVAAISTQTLRLLNSAYWLAVIIGIFLIWSEVLPALKLLNNFELWSNKITSESGGITFVPITLANVLLALIVLLMTFFISRNIPGLLEIAILQRLPFTASGRYAIATITRYILVIVGLTMTFNAIGIGWSKVQWLAAAITVGLGFGLQEIFANFVSGLIILFERQIRVGDAVTVGNISGKVSRIQMRATTITDWDRKELIIPNKEFVTGQVINWSLSDTILRIIIPVGIAYGSDTKLAYETLMVTAHEHPNVLDEPEPNVRFIAFGESSLNFELRVYIPHPDLLLETTHALHMDIDQRFREAKIEIAFPQRDIHIRDIPNSISINTNGTPGDTND